MGSDHLFKAMAVAGIGPAMAVASTFWSPGPAPQPGPELRARASSAVVYDSVRGRIVLFGGYDGNDNRNDTWEYDGTSWTLGPPAPPALVPRSNHAMAYDAVRGYTVMFGGSGGVLLQDTWTYDGSAWSQVLGASPPARYEHAMAFDSVRGRTVLFGGYVFKDTWEFDGTSWISGPAAPAALTARGGHAMAFDAARALVVLFGGSSSGGWQNDTWEYDGVAWTAGPAAPAGLVKRYGHAMAYDPIGSKVVVVGGYGSTFLSDVWTYDGTGWSAGPPVPPAFTPRTNHTMAFDAARGRLVVHGGYASYYPLDDVWELGGGTWTEGVRPTPVLVPRSYAAMAYDSGRARVVLYGGEADYAQRNDTWEYDGTAWTPGAQSPSALGPRYAHAMCFDSSRGRTVLFGGGWPPRNDTWEYDGSAWTQGPPAPAALTARALHAMAFDSWRGRTVLFGGDTYSISLQDDTWEYDGSAWTLGVAAPASMAARRSHAMAFDSLRGKVVLFGGEVAFGIPDDTWEYDGTAWVQGPQAPLGLTPRSGHAMAFDGARGVTVLFSGATLADTWEYDGTAWQAGAAAPIALWPRRAHAMAFDEARGVAVVFGGQRGYSFDLGDTWEYGACPVIDVQPSTLPSGTWYQLYAESLSATGGAPPYSFAVTAGTLPPGLGVGATGLVSGTPTRPGDFSFTVTAIDANGCSGSRDFTLTIDCPAIVISPASLPGGAVGASYSQTITASGGLAPYRFFLTAGLLPPGLALDASGLLSGTPAITGLFNFTVDARDGNNCLATRSYGLSIACGSTVISPATLPTAIVGSSYVVVLQAAGGTPPYTFAIVSGALPPGLMLSGGGLLSGVPAAGGNYGFTVRATDAAGCAGTRPYSIAVRQAADHVAGEGLGPPNPNRVRLFTGQGTSTSVDFLAYGANGWGVNVGAGRIEGGAFEAMLTGPGPGEKLGPQMRGFRRDGAAIAKVNFFAYGTQRSGLNVASAELDGDGYDEMVTGPGPGLVFGPHVRAFNFDGAVVTAIAKVSFYATMTLRYGVNVAGASIDADGYGEILTGAGPSPAFAPEVRGFEYDAVAVKAIAKVQFVAFGAAQYGVNVAGGDADGDGYAEMACAPGPGAALPARFLGFNYDGVVVGALKGFDLTAYGTLYGGRAGFGDVEPDGREELLTGAGRDPAADATIKRFAYDGTVLTELPGSFVGFGLSSYGINVIGGDLGL